MIGVMADSDAAGEEDEDQEVQGENNSESNAAPSILTAGLLVKTAEGTTVNLPCKVDGSRKYKTVVDFTYRIK